MLCYDQKSNFRVYSEAYKWKPSTPFIMSNHSAVCKQKWLSIARVSCPRSAIEPQHLWSVCRVVPFWTSGWPLPSSSEDSGMLKLLLLTNWSALCRMRIRRHQEAWTDWNVPLETSEAASLKVPFCKNRNRFCLDTHNLLVILMVREPSWFILKFSYSVVDSTYLECFLLVFFTLLLRA